MIQRKKKIANFVHLNMDLYFKQSFSDHSLYGILSFVFL